MIAKRCSHACIQSVIVRLCKAKIGLKPEESNALSQMWAWAIADKASPLNSALNTFMNLGKS